LYLLLGKNFAMPAAGGAIVSYTKALYFRNGKSFRRVTKAVDVVNHLHKKSPGFWF
jgi:hypothetical protein